MTSQSQAYAASPDEILPQITEDLYGQVPVSSAVILVIDIFFWLSLKTQADFTLLTVWAITLALTTLARLSVWYFRKQYSKRFSDRTWLTLYSASCMLVGASWSLIFLSVIDWNNLTQLAAPWMLIIGVLSAASVALGQHIPTFLLYTAPTVLISGTLLFLRSTESLGWLMAAYVAYYFILIGFTRANNRTYLARLTLSAENQSLLNALRDEAASREGVIAQRTSELSSSNEKLAEQISRRQQLELRTQQDLELLSSVINATSDLIYYKDYSQSDGRYLGCNNAFADFLGESLPDIIGKTDDRFFTREESAVFQAADTVAFKNGSHVIEHWMGHPNGKQILLSVALSSFNDAQGRVSGVVGIARDITAQKKTEETLRFQQRSLEHLAHHDALTGLPNRLYLIDKLNHALASPDKNSTSLAVLFLDLDHFKDINDSLGHSLGDEVLRAVSHRLRECVRKADIIARLGGDEFTIVLQGVGSSVTAVEVARKILSAFQAPLPLSDRELNVSTSIGISVSPGDGVTTEELLRNADAAMYRAKRSGRNTFMHYTPDMTERALARLSMESDMHRALARDEFYVAYQPQVDMRSGELIGVEALMRWEHATKGNISPEKFIPVAEENGLIVALGNWILETVCAEQKRLRDDGITGIRFAVNVSGRQLLNPDFLALVKNVVSQPGCNGRQLELEITESVLLHEPELAASAMQSFRDLGIAISVDDFGTGYSSLAYLKQYPLNRLKIDASFVRDIVVDPNDRAIAQTIIALGKALNLEVIAEGVETEEQRAMLIKDGCHLGQGFLFSKAVSPADLLAYHRSLV